MAGKDTNGKVHTCLLYTKGSQTTVDASYAYCTVIMSTLKNDRYGIRCQVPAAERASLCQDCRPVKTKASASRACSGGASRTISKPADTLDSAGGSPGVPPAQ